MARRGENIYHRKDGRWEGRYWIGTQPDGRRIYKSVYGRRYADVRRELAIQRASLYLSQEKPRSGDVLFEECAACFLEFKVKHFVKETTLVGYRRLIVQHLVPEFGGMPLGALEPEDLQRYFSRLNGTPSHGTIGNIFSLLRTILWNAYADGKLTRQIWQNVRLPRASKPPVRVLNREEQTKVEKLAFEQGRFEFILCLYTGTRLGELCALQWEDVDLEGRRLIIRHGMQRISSGGSSRVAMGTPKSASSRREIPLPTFLCAMLREQRLQTGEDARFVIPGKNDMFGDLDDYRETKYLCKYPIISLQSAWESQPRQYVLISLFDASMNKSDPSYIRIVRTAFDSDEDKQAFINEMRARSIYDIPLEADAGDQLLTLVTCSYSHDNGRFLLFARELRDDETEEQIMERFQSLL